MTQLFGFVCMISLIALIHPTKAHSEASVMASRYFCSPCAYGKESGFGPDPILPPACYEVRDGRKSVDQKCTYLIEDCRAMKNADRRCQP